MPAPQGDDEGAAASAAAPPVGEAETEPREKVDLDAYGPKELRTCKRLKKMKEYECAICMVQL